MIATRTSDALGELAEPMAAFLKQLADQLDAGWSRESADRMLNEAGASVTMLGTPTGRWVAPKTEPGSTHALPRPARHYRGCAPG